MKSQPRPKPTSNSERRCVTAEVRMLEASGKPCVRGYGIVYGRLSEVLTSEDDAGECVQFREIIAPGAADPSIAEADLRVNVHHDNRFLLGRRSAGTARFGSDDNGVWYEADVPSTTFGLDVIEQLKRGDITGSSFAFVSLEDEWSEPDDQGIYTRTQKRIHVFDMGPVVYPAFPDARAAYRSLEAHRSKAAPPNPTPDLLRLLHELDLIDLT